MEEEKHYSKVQEKYANTLKEINSLNYTSQNDQLIQKGFTNNKKNLKLLKKYNGDLNKVLDEQSNKSVQREQRVYKKLAAFGLVEKNQKLIDMGYTDVKLNLRCLKQSNNELEGALQRLQSKKKQSKDEIPDLNAKVKELISKGYKNYRKNQKILKKCDGDVEEAIQFLNKKVEKKELKLKVRQIAGQELLTKEAKDIDYAGKTLYLDGNNILFVDDKIRTTYLKKNRQASEKMLEAVAIRFAQQQKLTKLVLIFDGKGQKFNKNLNGLQFTRTFAEAENYQISDDYLAKTASELKEEFKQENIFVTSDRELIDRIFVSGCQLVQKSPVWMKTAKEHIGQEEFDKLLNDQQ